MLSTITDPERISREGRTRPSRAQSSRRKWEESWRCRRWAGYITATNDEPPEQRPSSLLIVPISDVVDLRFAPLCGTLFVDPAMRAQKSKTQQISSPLACRLRFFSTIEFSVGTVGGSSHFGRSGFVSSAHMCPLAAYIR